MERKSDPVPVANAPTAPVPAAPAVPAGASPADIISASGIAIKLGGNDVPVCDYLRGSGVMVSVELVGPNVKRLSAPGAVAINHACVFGKDPFCYSVASTFPGRGNGVMGKLFFPEDDTAEACLRVQRATNAAFIVAYVEMVRESRHMAGRPHNLDGSPPAQYEFKMRTGKRKVEDFCQLGRRYGYKMWCASGDPLVNACSEVQLPAFETFPERQQLYRDTFPGAAPSTLPRTSAVEAAAPVTGKRLASSALPAAAPAASPVLAAAPAPLATVAKAAAPAPLAPAASPAPVASPAPAAAAPRRDASVLCTGQVSLVINSVDTRVFATSLRLPLTHVDPAFPCSREAFVADTSSWDAELLQACLQAAQAPPSFGSALLLQTTGPITVCLADGKEETLAGAAGGQLALSCTRLDGGEVVLAVEGSTISPALSCVQQRQSKRRRL